MQNESTFSYKPMTVDQKQRVRRDHAAATVRQLATILDELARNAMDSKKKYDYEAGKRALQSFANDISEGRVNPRRWEFLTWIQEPKDLDSLGQNATSVTNQSSG